MDCAQTREALHGYLDRELDALTARALEVHLQSCTGCQQAYETQASLHAAVARHATYHSAADSLVRRVRAATGAVADPGPASWPRRQWLQLGTAVAATAAVTWIAALQLGSLQQDDAIVDQVIAGHARAVLTSHLTDVASSDQHTVKPWLSARLDFSPPVVDLTTAGFPLVGGRLDYLDSRTVAALVYHHRQHVINLFVWPKAKQPEASKLRARQGYNVLSWSSAGMAYFAVSDLNAEELSEFSRLYQQQAASPAAKVQSRRSPPA